MMRAQSRIVSKMLQCRSLLVWIISISLLTRVCDGSSARTQQTASSNSAAAGVDGGQPSVGRLTPDRFVSAAPLIMAAVCSDGVAILATHTSFSDEPLILDDDESHDNATTTSTETGSNTTITRMPRDLPRSYRGPFRINLIDGFGTSLVCAGWRADGEMLAQACRSLASSELEVFGEPSFRTCEYGHYIASEASLWMAQCAVSESRRSLSCVGILACSSDHSPGGYLWLIDATGAYRVQSHAVGGGSWSQDGNVASLVNEQLAAVDFTSLSKEQGVKELLEILANHTVGMSAAPRVEMATVGAKPRRGMERQFATSSLFGVTQ